MYNGFIKLAAIVIFYLLISSCQIDELGEKLQVFNEDGEPFNGNINIVGIPLVSSAAFADFEAEFGLFIDTFPGATFGLSGYPWQLNGKVKAGKMSIDFPDGKLELTSDYENSEGVKISQVHIEMKNNNNMKFGLHIIGSTNYSRVYIFYSSNDFDKLFNGRVKLKAGWNFIEVFDNPNWVYGGNEPYESIGLITQNIDDVLEKGYRWKIEYWI